MPTCTGILVLGLCVLFWSGQQGIVVSGWSTNIIRPAVIAGRRPPHAASSSRLRLSLSLVASVQAKCTINHDVHDEHCDVQQQATTTCTTAGAIASSFETTRDSFDPWLSNRHVQTIGGFFLRDTIAAYVPRGDPVGAFSRILQAIASKVLQRQNEQQESSSFQRPKFWNVRERIETPDGDWFHADTLFPTTTTSASSSNTATVLLLHGLESNSDSSLSHQMAAAFAAQGMKVTCLNFRSCSQNRNGQLILNDKLGFYHMGFTQDLFLYLDRLREQSPNTKVFIAGFSLGANVVLKALGELGTEALTLYNIQGAAVVCAPLDQERNSVAFSQPGLNRRIYSDGIVQKLQEKALWQFEAFCHGNENTAAFDYRGVCEAKTISDIDRAFVSPVFGFRDHIDYYRQTSSIHFLEKITVPTFILNAKDDPFFDNDVFPIEKTVEHGGVAPIKMVQMPSGGHLGFCFHQVPRDDERLVDNKSTGSWMPAELARFFQHVMNFRVESDRHDANIKTPRTAFYSQRITSSEVPVEMNVEDEFERAGNNQEYNVNWRKRHKQCLGYNSWRDKGNDASNSLRDTIMINYPQ